MTARTCLFFDDPVALPEAERRRELGGKGLSLRRIHKCGFRVPAGFTLRSSVCRSFLEHNEWPEGSWKDVRLAIERLAAQAAGPAGTPEDPPGLLLLAVRSGAAVSMPGLLQTRLNVLCHLPLDESDANDSTGCDDLRAAIEDVFHSWKAPAAIQFRQQNNIDEDLGTAVTVQRMIACDAAGVMFTCSDQEDESLLIEAVAGGGEKLVSGEATPHQWIVRRSDPQVTSAPPEDDHCGRIVSDRLQELVTTGLQLEEEFGEPLDIEWGIDDEGIVLFQARSIVASKREDEPSFDAPANIEHLRFAVQGGGRFWVRASLSETLASPTPLTWSLWKDFMSGGGGLGTLYRRLGYRPGESVRHDSFLRLIGGEIYADVDRATAMFGEDWPFRYRLEDLRKDPTVLDRAPRHFDVDRLDPFFLWRIPGMLWRGWRRQRTLPRLMSGAGMRFERQVLPEFLQYVSEEHQRDLTMFGDDELPVVFEARRRRVMDEFAPESLLPGTLGGIAAGELSRQLTTILGTAAAQQAISQLLPAGDVELIRRQLELIERIEDPDFKMEFVEEFGHRAVGEMELAVPRWRETHAEVSALVPRDSSDLKVDGQRLDQDTARSRLQELLRDAGAASLFPAVEPWFDRCWKLLPYRDRGRHQFLRGYELLRDAAEEVGRRFDLGDDVYFLRADEWPDLIAGGDLRGRIETRKRERTGARRLQLPDVIDAHELDALIADSPRDDGPVVLQGTPLVFGECRGVVCQLASEDIASLTDPVVVCGALEPSLLPMLGRCAGVVVERGGALSHGAILARQLGIPVVRMEGATRRLPTGQLVRVDGETGRIEVLTQEESR